MSANPALFFLISSLLTLIAHAEEQWKVIDEGFLLTVPLDWQKQPVQPIDSNAGIYKSERTDLEFDEYFEFGGSTKHSQKAIDDLKKKEANPNLLKPNEEVWHVRGRLADFWNGNVDPKIYGQRRFSNVASLFIPYKGHKGQAAYLNSYILYKSEEDLPTVRRVLESVEPKGTMPYNTEWLTGAGTGSSQAQMLKLPLRATNALAGQEFVKLITPLPAPPDTQRESLIYAQIIGGNVPDWMRKLVLITTNAVINGTNHTVSYYVTPDYLCIGSDKDYFLEPMTPVLAQRIANRLDCSLPTRKMVKDIWAQAQVKLTPTNLPPSAAMITVPVFNKHNSLVWTQRQACLDAHPLGALVAGHKKDVVISALMLTNFHKSHTPVVIYGWQQTNGEAIQPIYNGHAGTWADYSHGIRLVQQTIMVDGALTTVSAVLTNAALAALLSDETNFPGNVVPRPYYAVPSGN